MLETADVCWLIIYIYAAMHMVSDTVLMLMVLTHCLQKKVLRSTYFVRSIFYTIDKYLILTDIGYRRNRETTLTSSAVYNKYIE